LVEFIGLIEKRIMMIKEYNLNHNIIFRELLDYVLNMLNAEEKDYYEYWKIEIKKYNLDS
jgi:hypothetical protein